MRKTRVALGFVQKLKFLIVLFIFQVSVASAVNFTDQNVKNIFQQIENVYSARNYSQIKAFLEYNCAAEAKFKRQIILVDYQDSNKILKSESFDLTLSQYVEFIASSLTEFDKYSYKINVDKITPVADGYALSVAINSSEYGSKVKYVKNSKQQNITAVSGSCNFILSTSGSILQISGSSCIEKVVKYTIGSDGSIINSN